MSSRLARRLRRYESPRRHGWDPYDHAHPILRWYFYQRLEVALALARLAPHQTAVDLGCWMGHLEVSLVERVRRVVGIDRADEICREPYFDARVSGWNCLQIAREMVSIEVEPPPDNCVFMRADVGALPLTSASADVVFCLDTLEHVPDLGAALIEIRRIMKDDATLVVSLPIELGPALVARQLAGALTGFYREPYTLPQLVRSLFTRRAPVETRRGGLHHAGYDWRADLEHLSGLFKVEVTRFVPLGPLGAINPTVIVRARKVAAA